MLNSVERRFTLIYIIIVLIEQFTALYPQLELAHYFAKPSIVFALILLVFRQQSRLAVSFRYLLLSALIFSLIGDFLLMFVSRSEWYFISGLVAFLVAHIFYVALFLRQRHKTNKPFMALGILYLYSVGFGYLISDSLGTLLIPVVIYEIVILLMVSAAILRKNAVNSISYHMVASGALFFLLSDSILAVNKFYAPIALSGVWIMITYSLAQYLIVLGILKSKTVTS
jgi:uncharacterized membrane protein YhhN